MSEADAEYRYCWREAANDVRRDTSLARRAGTWREDDVRGAERRNVIEGDGIVPTHDRLTPQLAHIASQVVDKRVVVVDE
jgi:hypothetical protein